MAVPGGLPAAGPPGQEVQQLQAGAAGLVEVVEQQQDGLLPGEAAEEGGDRLERAAPLQLGGAALVGGQGEQLPHLRDQLGQGAGVVAGGGLDPPGRQPQDQRAHRLGQRLQEQRPLGLVAAGGHHQPTGGLREAGQLLGQAGLADAGLAADQHHPGVMGDRRRPCRGQRGQLGLAADEGGLREPSAGPFGRSAGVPARRRAGGGGGGRRRLGGRVLAAEDGEVQGGGLRAGVGAELVGEPLAQALVGGQGGGRLGGAPVGQHHGPVGRLVQRVGRHRGAGVDERPGRVAAGQGGLPGDPADPAGQRLDLPAGLGRPVGVRLVGQQRAPAEQAERPLGGGAGQGRLAGGEPAFGLAGQPFRLLEVDLDARPGGEPPAVPVAGDRPRPQDASQPADQGRQVRLRIGRRPGAPEHLGEHVGADQRAAPGQQHLQQGAGLSVGDLVGGQGLAASQHRERPEDLDPELVWRTHRPPIARCPRHCRGCSRPRPRCKRPATPPASIGGVDPTT